MTRDVRRVVLLGAAGAVFLWLGHDRPKQQPDAAGPAMRAYLDAPDMGLHCFDDHSQPVKWQYVSPDDAWRFCGVTPQRLLELRSTNWQAVAATKQRADFNLELVCGGLAWLALGVWLLRIAHGSATGVRSTRAAGTSETAVRFWMRRRRSDRLWLLAWLLAIPAVFLLPQLPRDTLITLAGVGGLLWLFIVLPGKAIYSWLQARKDEQEAKLARATRRDTRQHLATGRPVTSASEEERLGL